MDLSRNSLRSSLYASPVRPRVACGPFATAGRCGRLRQVFRLLCVLRFVRRPSYVRCMGLVVCEELGPADGGSLPSHGDCSLI